MKTLSILDALKNKGFDLSSINEEVQFLMQSGVIIKVSNKDFSGFSFRFESSFDKLRLLVTAEIYDLDKEKPKIVISNYDEVSFFDDLNSLEDYEHTIEHIQSARLASIALVKEISEIIKELQEKAIQEVKRRNEVERTESIIAEEKRLKRIEEYNKSHRKLTSTEVERVMKNMEEECLNNQEKVSKEFEFLTNQGYAINRTYSTNWEKQQVAWRDNRNNLIDPVDIKKALKMARI